MNFFWGTHARENVSLEIDQFAHTCTTPIQYGKTKEKPLFCFFFVELLGIVQYAHSANFYCFDDIQYDFFKMRMEISVARPNFLQQTFKFECFFVYANGFN